jgi:hypothetical protein
MIGDIFANLPEFKYGGCAVAVVQPAASVEDPAGIGSASFTAADLAWERCQEQAALAYRAGDVSTASRLWADALEIATKHFGRGDPRLAASLTNQALVMRRRRQDYQAKRLFEDAFAIWADSWRWILLMTPGHPAGPVQSAHSDQLEIYDASARAYFTALVERGRAATARLEHRDELPKEGLADWFELKPKRLSDLRKLLAAVLLIAPDPHS